MDIEEGIERLGATINNIKIKIKNEDGIYSPSSINILKDMLFRKESALQCLQESQRILHVLEYFKNQN